MKLQLLGVGAIGLLSIAFSATNTSPAQDAVDRFTASAVAINQPGTHPSSPVDVIVTRWATNAERDTLLRVLLEQGPSKLADALDKMPRAALLRPVGQLGIEFEFAGHRTLEDGSERIVLLTERPISYWPIARSADLEQYPFTLVEFRLGANGQGEGKLSLATRIIADKEHRTIELEDYVNQPVLLENVRRAKAAR